MASAEFALEQLEFQKLKIWRSETGYLMEQMCEKRKIHTELHMNSNSSYHERE